MGIQRTKKTASRVAKKPRHIPLNACFHVLCLHGGPLWAMLPLRSPRSRIGHPNIPAILRPRALPPRGLLLPRCSFSWAAVIAFTLLITGSSIGAKPEHSSLTSFFLSHGWPSFCPARYAEGAEPLPKNWRRGGIETHGRDNRTTAFGTAMPRRRPSLNDQPLPQAASVAAKQEGCGSLIWTYFRAYRV